MNKANIAGYAGTSWRDWLFAYAPYIGIGIILLIIPAFISTYFQSLLTKVLIFAIFAMSLDLILGYTGLLSLGHAAYLGVAGYTAGLLIARLGLTSFWIVAPAAIVMAGIAAAIIGYISLRVSGVYFLLVTLAFGQLLSVVAVKWRAVTGGTDGLVGIIYPDFGIPGLTLTDTNYYYLVFIAFAVCFFLLYRLINSPFGKALVGIRENESRMKCLGYNTWAHKYIAFIVSGLFAGVAGVLFAPFYGIMVPGHLGLMTSSSVMLMVVIGGAGTLFGPVIGAIVVLLLEHFASIYTPERWPLILGVVFVICVLFIRGGFGFHLSKFWSRLRIRYGNAES